MASSAPRYVGAFVKLHSVANDLVLPQRAGGDVKRTGQADPFSYVPLSKATKQKNPNSRVSLTNKKKGSRQG